MTPELCQRICFENNNFKFAGVQNAKECFCGNDEPPASKVMPRSHCNSPCSGNPHMMCGGSLRMNVYRNQGKLSGEQIILVALAVFSTSPSPPLDILPVFGKGQIANCVSVWERRMKGSPE